MSQSPQDRPADEYARQFMPPERRARLDAEQPVADTVEETVAVADAPPAAAAESVEEVAEASGGR